MKPKAHLTSWILALLLGALIASRALSPLRAAAQEQPPQGQPADPAGAPAPSPAPAPAPAPVPAPTAPADSAPPPAASPESPPAAPAAQPPPATPPPEAAPPPAAAGQAPAAPAAASPAPAPKPAAKPRAPARRTPPPPELFDINYTNVQLEDLLKTYAKWMGKNFLLTDKLKQAQITVYSERKVTKDEAWRVFEAILRANGYTIVPGDEVNRIIASNEAVSDLIPTYSSEGLTYGSRSFSAVTRLFPLQYVSTTDMKAIVQKFLSKGADVMDYPASNLLIVTDSSAHINRVIKLLKELDVPSSEDTVEILQVRFTSATDMAGLIENIQGGAGKVARGPAPQPAGTANLPGKSTARIIPDDRNNTLIVVGSKKEIREVKKLLALLDVDTGGGSAEVSVFVYYLQYADAGDVASALNAIITGTGGTIGGSSAGAAGGAASAGGASRGGFGGSKASGGSSLQQRSQQRQAQTSQALGGGGATGAAQPGAQGLSSQFESDIRITADKGTNSLLITCTRRDFETIKRVIEKLDRPRRQVFVEAAILEVGMNDSFALGFSLFGGGAKSGGPFFFGQQNFGNPPSPLGAVGANAITALAGSQGITAGIIGQQETLDLGGGNTITIPTYGALLSAAKSDSHVNVLSTPTVLTSDNEQAQIIIANNVPIPTGQTIGTGGVTQSTLTREDIGITMRITPRINEGDSLKMQIFVEISDIAAGSFGIDVAQQGIITKVRSAETTVSVKDRQPIVIGGLISANDSVSETKVPVLGDIPILGALFRSRRTIKDKQNLIILITPQIVRDHFDASRVMALEVEERKPILEDEVLRRWLERKNTEAAQESFRHPPEEDRLPPALEPGELLVTPDGVYTPDTYPGPERRDPKARKKPSEEHSDEIIGPIQGLRKKESAEAPAGTGAPAAGAALPPAAPPIPGAPPPPAAPPGPVDPEQIRKQIFQERDRRIKEREDRARQQQGN